MAFTNEEVLRMTSMALKKHHRPRLKLPNTTPIIPWVYPSDWPDLEADWPMNGSERVGAIRLLIADRPNSAAILRCVMSNGGYYHVDWGDGNSETVLDSVACKHAYAEGWGLVLDDGTTVYIITITALDPEVSNIIHFHSSKFSYGILAGVIHCPSITSLLSVFCMHYGIKYVKFGKFDGPVDFEDAFDECFALKTVLFSGSVTVGNFYNTFFSCVNLVSIDLSKVSTPVPVYCDDMFGECTALREIIFPPDKLKVSSARYMFEECGLSYMDCRQMELPQDCYYFAAYCNNLTKVTWDNPNVVNLNGAFYGSASLVEFELLCPLENLQTASRAFSNTSIASFDFELANMISLVDASSLFRYSAMRGPVNISMCPNLVTIDSMFSQSPCIPSLYIGDNLFENVTDIDFLFDSSPVLARSFPFDREGLFPRVISLSSFVDRDSWHGTNENIYPTVKFGSTAFASLATSTVTLSLTREHFFHEIYTPNAKYRTFKVNGGVGNVLQKITISPLSPFSTGSTVSPHLDIQDAKLETEALNDLFDMLPTTTTAKFIRITRNPGALTCDKTIATNKGWQFV